ncbi:hypothetical protein DAEQUDRAFT_764276 [Daedalea quercina L-15889]|uniref:Uncharacterized protein n=1 Tax=Daedalea quercina L-15889 TaxID=1314783 RepID=A0A165RQV1_9APHY|nr:hypothetical protein DAEQUDRAFT_764276 [Daedalea quercina L-15889]
MEWLACLDGRTAFGLVIRANEAGFELISHLLYSLIFYTALSSLLWSRFSSKRSRTLVILGTIIFTGERVVDFSVCTAIAYDSDLRTRKAYVKFLQSGYAIGVVGMTQDIGTLIMAFLVNSTRGDASTSPVSTDSAFDVQAVEDVERAEMLRPKLYEQGSSASHFALQVSQAEVLPDEPRRRHWIRMFTLAQLPMRLTAMALGAVSSGSYAAGESDHYDALLVPGQHTRYISAGITLFLLQSSNLLVLWGLVTRPARVALVPTLYLSTLCCILSITPIYRLVAMTNYTDALPAMGPGSHNGTASKALFCGLQITPETIALLMLLVVNVKKMFGVHDGLVDMAFTDPKPKRK